MWTFTSSHWIGGQRNVWNRNMVGLISQVGDARERGASRVVFLGRGPTRAAGEGRGLDRLAMIFTDSASFREVIIFQHL